MTSLSVQYFFWLPNALTASRLVLSVPICVAAANGAWKIGFWLLIVAITTDFFDGLAAKKLQAYSKLGGWLDPVADRMLVFAGFLGLVLADKLPALVLGLLLVLALVVWLYSGREFSPTTDRRSPAQKIISITILFMCWVYLSWAYLAAAYGWSWWYVPLTLVLWGASAMLKRHRLRAWLEPGPVNHRRVK